MQQTGGVFDAPPNILFCEVKLLLLQPSNVSPSLYLGDGSGIIDATQSNTFSATINGKSPVVAYQSVIFKNNATSDIVYDSGVIPLQSPFYGSDYSGNNISFEYTIPSNDHLLPSHTTIENGYIYGYKHILLLWWDLNTSDYSANRVISYEYVFYARAAVAISINNFWESLDGDNLPVVNSRNCSWSANYNQQGIRGTNWFRWTLAPMSDKSRVIAQTEKIYSNSEIKFAYDALIAGTKYSIMVELQTPDGVTVSSGWVDFSVNYEQVQIGSAIEVTQKAYGVELVWGNVRFIEGTPSDNGYGFVQNMPVPGSTCVEISPNTEISFTSSEHFQLEVSIDGGIYYCLHFDDDNPELFYASGVDADGSPYYLRLSHSGSMPGLAPSNTLVPSDDLAPLDSVGGYFELDVNGTITYIADSGFPPQYWFVLKMSKNELTILEQAPFVAS